jgi:hypothetical protein
MRVALTSALLAVVVCATACGGSGAAPHAASPKAVTSAERKAIFNDWYVDGRIDNVYPCSVVQDAIRRLPSTPPIGSSVVQDFQHYERRVC